MFKQILLTLAKKAIMLGANYLYNYIDKDRDGNLNKYEIELFIEDLRSKLTKIKRKI